MQILLIFLFFTGLFAKEHTVMVEPYQIYQIKSDVNAKVIFSDIENEGKEVKNHLLIKLDDAIDRASLQSAKRRLAILQNSLNNEKNALSTLKKILQIKRRNYERIKDLRTKSLFEKEQRLADYLAAQNSYQAKLSQIDSIKQQIEDLKLSIKKLQDQIAKKNIKVSGYVYKIYPKKGDVVTIGQPLVDLADTSKAKVVLYLSKEELGAKKISIDGKSGYHFSKVWRIPDQKRLGLYRAEILLPKQEIYGKFVKVEIK